MKMDEETWNDRDRWRLLSKTQPLEGGTERHLPKTDDQRRRVCR